MIEASEACRFPLLSDAGRRMLMRLREHPHAPMFRNASGHRLTAEDLRQVLAFERDMQDARIDWTPATPPQWLDAFVQRCREQVPHYRQYATTAAFDRLPTVSRADLSRDITRFVPDDLPLDRLLQFSTSGTTGHPLLVPSHPRVAASYLAFHKRALARIGIELCAGQGDVAVALVGFQKRCFTYASVTPAMGEAGLVKLNLHPDDWRQQEDRGAYLDDLAPELITGDPISLSALAELDMQHRPRALLSTSMALSRGLRERLQVRFGCPVLDLYSMNEAGPIASFDAALGGHVLLQPHLYIEILDGDGKEVPAGQRGEIVLSRGFNDWLPLLRYRTGDHAALHSSSAGPLLVGLEGRPPVRFRLASGEWINNVDVSHALGALALPQFALHQCAQGSLVLRIPAACSGQAGDAEARLCVLFGAAQDVMHEILNVDDKLIQYTSDLPQDAIS